MSSAPSSNRRPSKGSPRSEAFHQLYPTAGSQKPHSSSPSAGHSSSGGNDRRPPLNRTNAYSSTSSSKLPGDLQKEVDKFFSRRTLPTLPDTFIDPAAEQRYIKSETDWIVDQVLRAWGEDNARSPSAERGSSSGGRSQPSRSSVPVRKASAREAAAFSPPLRNTEDVEDAAR